jgi:group I intron endonuclease
MLTNVKFLSIKIAIIVKDNQLLFYSLLFIFSLNIIYFISGNPESFNLVFNNSETNEFFNNIVLFSSIVPVKIYIDSDTMKQDIIKDNNKKAGVYRWVNNKTNNTYIGSSINLSNRFRLYYNYDIISDKNKNKSMINEALVKHGYSKFSLEILEYCDSNIVLEREQYYLDLLSSEYNILKIAGNLSRFKYSEEFILKRMNAFAENRKIKETIESKEILNEDIPFVNFPLKGSIRPQEVIDKIRKNHSRSKIVYEYKVDKITLIAKYDSLRQASFFLLSGLNDSFIYNTN